jgi:hypothetical protein
MKPLKIYFGDLTHDSIGLATEVFPLNIGFVAAYTKKIHGDLIEVSLYKYVTELEDAIASDPPDILALSNYPWCHNIGMALFEDLADRKPEALRFMGGPNFPHEPHLQEEFLNARPLIDAYAYLDGEVGCANFVGLVLGSGLVDARKILAETSLPGCAHLGASGNLIAEPVPVRITDLDEIPSPYLTGLLDKFFDGRLSPMIQTNRGCPFRCTYCADGTKKVSLVNQFSVQRVTSELEYIAQRVPNNITSLFISDLNYGMYKRDAEISDAIAQIRSAYGYPQYIDTTTGKNSKQRVIVNIEKLSGALSMTMSVQSMTPQVLVNIKRQNLRLDDFLGLQSTIKKVGLPTTAEAIVGLPGENRDTHINTLCQLVEAGIDSVFAYTLMMLNGSEMNTPENREKWGFKGKFRVIPRDFTKLKSGRNVIEVEEVVVETNTLSFEDYVYCRCFVLLLNVVNHLGFKGFLHFAIQNGLDIKRLFTQMLDAIQNGTRETGGLTFLFREFERETREELWDSEEALVEFFKDDTNFQGLLTGQYGANLLQTYRAKIWTEVIAELADHVVSQLKLMLDSELPDDVHRAEAGEHLLEIERFSRAKTYNLLGEDRLDKIARANLKFDLEAWLSDPEGRTLSNFNWQKERVVNFVLTKEQYTLVEDVYAHFGRTALGKGKVLIRVPINSLWRKSVMVEPQEEEFGEGSIVYIDNASQSLVHALAFRGN